MKKPLSAALIVVGLVIALSGCKNDPEVIPPPTAASIAPAFGQVGTVVTITGTNFGTDKTAVAVVFGNNIKATVESLTATEIKVKAPDESAAGPITVTVGDQSVQTPEFTFYSIYTFGAYGEQGGNTYRATYWKDDKRNTLSTTQAEINDMVVVGNDIHAVGYEYPDSFSAFFPVYWKNGTPVSITRVVANTTFKGVAVSGSDVYICGLVYKTAIATGVAKYWKNGQEFILDESTNAATTDIKVVNGDVYITGSVDFRAVYWKNGTKNILPQGSNASAVQVVGSDVFIAGSYYIPGQGYAKYWKNGVATTLTVTDNNFDVLEYESAYCINIVNGDIYVGGGMQSEDSFGGSRYVPKYWKNGTATSVAPESGRYLYVRSLSFFQNEIIMTVSADVFNAASYVYRNSEPIVSSPDINMRLTGHQIVTY